MKLHLLSDLHLEFGAFTPPATDADVVVLAGDIAEGLTGLRWAREQFPQKEIVYVLGNHEHYGQRLPDFHEQAADEARALGIHLLENREVVLQGVRFLGATLWTNFALYAKNEDQVRIMMMLARREMNDYRNIRQGRKRKKGRDRISPIDVLNRHQASHRFLTEALAQPFDGPTVVVTHHGPHRLSVTSAYAGHLIAPCYVSHLPELVRPPVSLWVHGHVHDSLSYVVEGTQVRTNPRGYRPPYHNPAFDPAQTVEV